MRGQIRDRLRGVTAASHGLLQRHPAFVALLERPSAARARRVLAAFGALYRAVEEERQLVGLPIELSLDAALLLLAEDGVEGVALGASADSPSSPGEAFVLGRLYVCWGAHLGRRETWRLIAGSAPRTTLAQLPSAYWTRDLSLTGWQHLIGLLDSRIGGEEEARAAEAGALCGFQSLKAGLSVPAVQFTGVSKQ